MGSYLGRFKAPDIKYFGKASLAQALQYHPQYVVVLSNLMRTGFCSFWLQRLTLYRLD
jgi:hypothetical protein